MNLREMIVFLLCDNTCDNKPIRGYFTGYRCVDDRVFCLRSWWLCLQCMILMMTLTLPLVAVTLVTLVVTCILHSHPLMISRSHQHSHFRCRCDPALTLAPSLLTSHYMNRSRFGFWRENRPFLQP